MTGSTTHVDEMAAAICQARRRRSDRHREDANYFGTRGCHDCLDLARDVVEELRPAPRLG